MSIGASVGSDEETQKLCILWKRLLNATEEDFAQYKKKFPKWETKDDVRKACLSALKHEPADQLILFFLRDCQYDVERALELLLKSLYWRTMEVDIEKILFEGEEGAVRTINTTTDFKERKQAEGFLKQLELGKSFVHGKDKHGRLINIIRVRFHRSGDQPSESLERSIAWNIETARLMLKPPTTQALLIFDLTGFGLGNMDFHPIKYMINCFETNYPGCLGGVVVYRAPWIFQSFWKIIKGLLDPNFAKRVHFASNTKALEEFISRDQILKEMGGDDPWQWEYKSVVAGENDTLQDEESRVRLLKQREELVDKFSAATLDWLRAVDEGKGIEEAQNSRRNIEISLQDFYWQLDPLIRARSVYDRLGMI